MPRSLPSQPAPYALAPLVEHEAILTAAYDDLHGQQKRGRWDYYDPRWAKLRAIAEELTATRRLLHERRQGGAA